MHVPTIQQVRRPRTIQAPKVGVTFADKSVKIANSIPELFASFTDVQKQTWISVVNIINGQPVGSVSSRLLKRHGII